ncbi:MAG: C10 family peptidase [Bacteroidetes bacterium]|nr:C10 family peptidase [Bacteroidota bacterium]
MKQILLALSIFFCIPFSYSEPVSRFRAQKIAAQLIPQAELLEESEAPGNQKFPYFIFTNKQSNSFVILAGDDQMEPILGYSDASAFDFKTLPPALRKLLEEYAKIAKYALKHPAPASQSIQDKWESLEKGNTSSFFKKAGVNPLIASKWDQGTYYNSLCPLDANSNERTVTGCVATAMAMVLKYWNSPAQGTGFHSYNHPKYGTLSANFANTTYNWSAMPNTVSSSNSAVATLMYHCGVSVDMNYGIGSTGGSGAYVISSASPVTHCTEYALKNYFGYKNTLQGLQRKNYTDAQWLNLLKAELDAQRPIIYAGFGSGGGHCFLVDGYDNSNKLHINWGWSGAYDGYFSLNAFNPDGLGTGGGTGEYTSGHQAVIGIQPSSPNPVASDLRLYSALSINPASISLGQSFSVSAQIANYATQAGAGFSGDLCAAVFNSANQHVAYVETKIGITIDPNFYNSFQFSTTGIASLTPGNYTISLFWKKSGTT